MLRALTGLALLLVLVAVAPLAAPGANGIADPLLVGYAPWFGAVAALSLLILLPFLGRRRTRPRLALTGLVVLALLLETTVTVQLLSTGWSQDAVVNPFVLHGPPDSADGPDDRSVYTRVDGDPLDVYVWRPAASGGAAPVMVYVHGGGWVSGNPAARAAQMRWFADSGWLVIAPEYPLSSSSRHLWQTTVQHVGCALVWAAEHSGELGGDPSRLALVGDSAGGNLAINAAYDSATGVLPSSCGGDPPTVQAVVGLYPVTDAVSFHDVTGRRGSEARSMTEAYLGGSPAEFPERYREVGSVSHLSPRAPPTLLFVPGSDQLVPPDGSLRLAEAAQLLGVDVTVVGMPHLDHGFDAAPLPDELYRRIVVAWLGGRIHR